MVKITKEAALSYHETGRPGKIEVKPTKPYHTQTDPSSSSMVTPRCSQRTSKRRFMQYSTRFQKVNAIRSSSIFPNSSPMVSYSKNLFSKAIVIYVRKQRVQSAICSSKSLPAHAPRPRYCLHSLFRTSMFHLIW